MKSLVTKFLIGCSLIVGLAAPHVRTAAANNDASVAKIENTPTITTAALVTTPWITLLGVSLLYLAAMPLSIASYGRVKRRRAIPVAPSSGGAPIRPAADNAR